MPQRGEDVEPALVGHHDVEQDHVRLQRPRLEDRLAPGAGLAHRLQVVLGLEQELQAGAHHCVVVDDQDADAHETGTSTTRVVPAPGFTRLTVCGKIFNSGGALYKGGGIYLIDAIPQ